MLQYESTPLHHAAFGGHQEVVKILANGGALIDVTNNVSQSCKRCWNKCNVYCLLMLIIHSYIIHIRITGSFSFKATLRFLTGHCS